jgi:hypothetical protein
MLLKESLVRVLGRLGAVSPYLAIELMVPGGSVIALLLWLYRCAERSRTRNSDAVANRSVSNVTNSRSV